MRAARISSSSGTWAPAWRGLLGYGNHANMGSYDDAIAAFLAGHDPKPDIVAYCQRDASRRELGANPEYTVPTRACLRGSGWNEGHFESFGTPR